METLNEKEIKISDLLHKKGLVIAGPCSAETEEQLLQTAAALAKTGKVDVLRAGIWKPRTNPGGFEGIGTRALSWMLKAKALYGLPTAIEVATPKHVEDALSFDTDILWIGARTTVNPFSVQQLADALKGTRQTILIKNPVNPDIKLWVGAVERLQRAGIENIGLIHRGFSSYGNTQYRNAPIWQIPIEMKRLFPELPLICDPSHISGKTNGIAMLSQKSIDLDYDGLIIESHIDPKSALTDREQQLTPVELGNLLSSLTTKHNVSSETDFLAELELLRERINQYDEELLNLIAGRMQVAKEIGLLKKKSQVTILQAGRYNDILEKALNKGESLGLSDKFIKAHLENIHIESIRIQQNNS